MGYWTTPKWVYEDGDTVELKTNRIWVEGKLIKLQEGFTYFAKVVDCETDPERWNDETEVELTTIHENYSFSLEASELKPVDTDTLPYDQWEEGMYALSALLFLETKVEEDYEERQEYERLKRKYG